MKPRQLIMLVVAALLAATGGAAPQQPSLRDVIPLDKSQRDAQWTALQANRVGIVTGGLGGEYARLGANLEDLVSRATGDKLRVIVSTGPGSLGNLRDLLALQYIDFAFVQSDLLASMKASDPDIYKFLSDNKIAFVAPLHLEALHILARDGPFTDPRQLSGKKIAVDTTVSGTAITTRHTLIDMLGVPFEPRYMRLNEAMSKLLSGDPDVEAIAYVVGHGANLFKNFKPDQIRKIQSYRIGFVPFAQSPPEDSPYEAASLSSTDYPDLIPEGDHVPVWATPAVLAAFDWAPTDSRYRRAKDFVEVLFDHRAELGDNSRGYEPNWCDVDLGRPLHGWRRFGPAKDWLKLHLNASTRICPPAPVSAGENNSGLPSHCSEFVQFMSDLNSKVDDSSEITKRAFARWLTIRPGKC